MQPDLTSANLRGADLSGMDLAGASLSLANLKKADLAGANLTGANLAGADLEDANMAGATLDGAILAGTHLVHAVLAGASLRKTNMAGANLTGRPNLSGADFTEANLAGAKLAGANLAGANLSRAILAGADFRGADLTGANLTEAVTSGAKFDGADLAGAVVRSHRDAPAARREEVEQLPEWEEEGVTPFTLPTEDDQESRLAALLAEEEPELQLDAEEEPAAAAFVPEEEVSEEEVAEEEVSFEELLDEEEDAVEAEAPAQSVEEEPLDVEELLAEEEPLAEEEVEAPAPSLEIPPLDEEIDSRVLSYETREMAILALYSAQIARKTPQERRLLVDLLTQYNRNVFPAEVRVPMVATGNAIIVGFDNPTDALRCGTIYIDMLREMSVESYVAVNWGKATSAIDESGDNHDELIVNSIGAAARLMPVASRGEVLILEELYAHPATQRDKFTFEHVTRTWKAMSDPGGRGVDVPCYSVRRKTDG